MLFKDALLAEDFSKNTLMYSCTSLAFLVTCRIIKKGQRLKSVKKEVVLQIKYTGYLMY